MFPDHIIHAECLGGDIDLICNRRVTIGFSQSAWRFVDGESGTGSALSGSAAAWPSSTNAEYDELIARKAALPKARIGDGYEPEHVESIQRLTRRF